MTGLQPREFVWIIAGQLAVAQRIGGYGFQHRRVRREEEILWLQKEASVNTILSFMSTNQNMTAYEEVPFAVHHEPVSTNPDSAEVNRAMRSLRRALTQPGAIVLVHRETVDDTLAGLLAGYLLYSKMVNDPIKAAAVVQEILGRPIGPVGRAIITRAA